MNYCDECGGPFRHNVIYQRGLEYFCIDCVPFLTGFFTEIRLNKPDHSASKKQEQDND